MLQVGLVVLARLYVCLGIIASMKIDWMYTKNTIETPSRRKNMREKYNRERTHNVGAYSFVYLIRLQFISLFYFSHCSQDFIPDVSSELCLYSSIVLSLWMNHLFLEGPHVCPPCNKILNTVLHWGVINEILLFKIVKTFKNPKIYQSTKIQVKSYLSFDLL